LNVIRYGVAGCGSTSDALGFGGSTGAPAAVSATEKLTTNGSPLYCWQTTSSLNTARAELAGCGTITDALSFGGFTGATVAVANTEI